MIQSSPWASRFIIHRQSALHIISKSPEWDQHYNEPMICLLPPSFAIHSNPIRLEVLALHSEFFSIIWRCRYEFGGGAVLRIFAIQNRRRVFPWNHKAWVDQAECSEHRKHNDLRCAARHDLDYSCTRFRNAKSLLDQGSQRIDLFN